MVIVVLVTARMPLLMLKKGMVIVKMANMELRIVALRIVTVMTRMMLMLLVLRQR